MTNVIIELVPLVFPQIYTPRTIMEGATAKYSISFEAEPSIDALLNPLGVFSKESRNGKSYYTANSTVPPLITCRKGDYGELAQAVQIAQARNMRLDALFKGEVADVMATVFSYSHPARKGIALGLNGLVLNDARQVLSTALADPVDLGGVA